MNIDLSGILSSLFTFFTNIGKYILDGFLWIISKALFLIYDGLLTVISAAFSAIDVASFVTSYAMDWAGVPSQLAWFIGQVGIPQGVAMLSGAIALRMALNLIPAAFTRI